MSRLLTALLVFTFFTIILGSWVRNAGAGLSCPDWPLCHGKIIPPMEYRIMLEYFHRLAASFVSILFLIICFWVLRVSKYRKKIGLWLAAAFAFLFLQIILGKLTVDRLLQWEVVATHLGVAVLFLSCIVVAGLKSRDMDVARKQSSTLKKGDRFLWTARLAIVVVYVQILLGGSVSSHYAGLACPDFPTCFGKWFPGWEGQVGIQFLHRLGALATTLVLVALLFQWQQLKIKSQKVINSSIAYGIGLLLGIQWLLGVTMILGGVNTSMTIPAPLSVAHSAIGVAIFISVLIANYEVTNRQLP